MQVSIKRYNRLKNSGLDSEGDNDEASKKHKAGPWSRSNPKIQEKIGFYELL
jgi:hypothetical protein